jgi:60 kDa SS-A/Ro ribonucleoprotein
MDYGKHLTNRKETPQTVAVPGRESEMAKNAAGGVVFKADKWTQLRRFLILGSEGGTYYVNERSHTLDNIESLNACLAEDGLRVVREIEHVSVNNLAAKQDPAIFALAVASKYTNDPEAFKDGSDHEAVEVRRAAREAMPRICRTASHMFMFAQALQHLGGWGRSTCKTFQNWYDNKSESNLAYQMIKYQNRNGWSHRDVLLKAHVKPASEVRDALYHWAAKGWEDIGPDPHDNEVLRRVWAVEKAKRAQTVTEVCSLIQDYNLPRECIPTQFLNDPKVWEALLQDMPMTAMIRNLGKMSAVGILGNMSENTRLIVDKLSNEEILKRARVHPMTLLNAQRIYARGRGLRGSNSWQVTPNIVDALDDAFYKAFDFVEPSGKRTLIGLDVSGSMFGASVMGMEGLTAAEASAAMAMTIMRTEPYWEVMGFQSQFTPVKISKRMRLDTVLGVIRGLPFGRTDCALPFTWASQQNKDFESFIVMTDNETYYGNIHPYQALIKYRKKTGIQARSAVLAMTATSRTIADPKDPGMIDVAGCDRSVPQLLTNFFKGEV